MKIYYSFLAILLALCQTSCEKLLDVGMPKDAIETSAVFSNTSNLNAAVAGMYSIGTSYGVGVMSAYASLMADDLLANINTYEQYKNNSLLSNDVGADLIWSRMYIGIYRANAIIEGIQAADFPQDLKNQIQGEALFLRAFFYNYLVNLYGDVPLIKGTNVNENKLAARVSKADVNKHIVEDLEKAVTLLPTSYPASGKRVRANKWVAKAFLARVYLYLEDYEKAEVLASEVIQQSDFYKLSSDLSKVFLNTSEEAIFAFDVSFQGYTNPGFLTVVLNNTEPPLEIHPSLMSLFESQDKRKANWMAISGGKYYPAKYKVRSGIGNEFDVVLRISEQYIIRAEARAHLNKLDGTKSDINVIRTRAGANPIDVQSKEQALQLIATERRMEFFFEWCHRWFDLKRTAKVNEVIGALKPGLWEPKDALFPIPDKEILLNKNLTQNEGYE